MPVDNTIFAATMFVQLVLPFSRLDLCHVSNLLKQGSTKQSLSGISTGKHASATEARFSGPPSEGGGGLRQFATGPNLNRGPRP